MEYNIPKSKLFRFDKLLSHNNINLLISGQGVFIFEYPYIQQPCSICFYNQDKTDGLKVDISIGGVRVNRISLLDPLIDPNNKVGLVDKKGAYYWISLDAQNQVISVGIGEARIETIIYKYQFKFEKEADDYRKENKKFLESLSEISKESNNLKPIKLLRDPITNKIPLIVRNTDKLSMNDIAKGTYLPKANLSLMAQKLYDCIAGKNFVLDDKDFPEFSAAIEHSIRTPGCWCYDKLQEKSTEFNKDKPNLLETYLRITLGSNNGESPGIPYVLEIWPVGHYSPVHNHGASSAIIRVLHGSINVSLFPYLAPGSNDSGGVERFGVTDFVKDQITWISPTLNQIHQLKNLDTNKDTCITIQCYMYDNENKYHYDYFDYIDDNGKIEQYEPDSDMEFIEFKKLMRKEWREVKRCKIFDIIKKCFNCF